MSINSARKTLLLLLLPSYLFSQKPSFTNVYGDSILLKEGAIIIVTNNMNCAGCLKMLDNAIKRKGKCYLGLPDSFSNQAANHTSLIKYRSLFKLSYEKYIFLAYLNPINTRERTPYLLLLSDGVFNKIDYYELFSEEESMSSFKRKLRLKLKSKK